MVEYFIHVEKAWDEKTWNNLTEFIKNHKCYLFLMTPNYYYQYSVLGYRGSEEELEKILKERYTYLISLKERHNYKIGIHIHFSLNPKELLKEEKKKILIENISWLSKFHWIDKIVSFGWFKSDEYLKNLCKEFNFEIKHYAPFVINVHDYDLPLSFTKKIENFIKDILRRLFRNENCR